MRYLIDSDWTINYLRSVRGYTERVRGMAVDGIAISIVSLAEIYEGIYSTTEPSAGEAVLQNFLSFVQILGLDDETCRIFGQVRGRLRAQGALVGDKDTLIGATALRHGLILLSNNRRHFERMQDIDIISVDP